MNVIMSKIIFDVNINLMDDLKASQASTLDVFRSEDELNLLVSFASLLGISSTAGFLRNNNNNSPDAERVVRILKIRFLIDAVIVSSVKTK